MSKKFQVNLDALAPESGEATIDGKTYEVKPPTTGQMVKLISTFQSFQSVMENNESTDEEIDNTANKLVDIVRKIVPELAEKKLEFSQLIGIASMIAEMSMPQTEELTKRKITPNEVKKNPLS